jgi:hypothetical protein
MMRTPYLAVLPQRSRHGRRRCIVSRCYGRLRGCASIRKAAVEAQGRQMHELYLDEMRETSFHPPWLDHDIPAVAIQLELRRNG